MGRGEFNEGLWPRPTKVGKKNSEQRMDAEAQTHGFCLGS